MTKRNAAKSIICTNNWCNDNCLMFDRENIKCRMNNFSEADLVMIARKEYTRKSKKEDGADYMRIVAEEWAIICKGATVV